MKLYHSRSCWFILACWVALGGLSCQSQQPQPLFRLLKPSATGVDFINEVRDSPELNILNYLYFYNGGGVAVGDLNADGLPDLYFTANSSSNRLYLNRGGLTFEEVTSQAGVGGQPGWTTGSCMADVNGDGWLDIYVCQVGGGFLGLQGHNQLYINLGVEQPGGVPRFEERAADFGLDFSGFGTQAAFFDYDLDGDLDAYLLNHSVHDNDTYQDTSIRRRVHPTAGDRLLRNEGHTFVDVSRQAGIYSSAVGYGLGIAIADVNQDGWPDIYVGNDFHENDYLYLNQGDGSFRESLERMIGHTSRFSMGVDIADINNDGLPEVLSLDMKPEREDILKTAQGPDPYNIFRFKLSYGYSYQYPHNALQLNRGVGYFSEIAQLAGIDATDWSWAALLADFDNDGLKDAFITNGIFRRPNDMDYIKFTSEPEVVRSLNEGITEENLSFIEKMPQVPIPNYLYHNQGHLRFQNRAAEWGMQQAGFSNGAAYSDLDLDGDLDLVVNNLNEPAFIYENRSRQLHKGAFVEIRLHGRAPNTQGVGTCILARHQGQTFRQEAFPVRGFQSGVDPLIHLGLGALSQLDSLYIIWPGGQYELRTQVPVNSLLDVQQEDATGQWDFESNQPQKRKFEDLSDQLGLDYVHRENAFIDFDREALMPYLLSTQGPALATADVKGDGLEDVFAGGAAGSAGEICLQLPDGRFRKAQQAALESDAAFEDVDAAFLDADADGDADLYVASGGNEVSRASPLILDRLYLNDGLGNLRRNAAALPPVNTNSACVRVADVDADGDPDLFVGGRSLAGYYGLAPRSFLLLNDGKGHFEDATASFAPELQQPGMLTDARWVDIDADGDSDLVVAGEWMPLTFFQNLEGKALKPLEVSVVDARDGAAVHTSGLWTCLWADDIDQDGDMDLFAGNLGWNSQLRASQQAPMSLYLKDFDQNGSIDPIISYFKNGQNFPLATKDEMTKQIVPLRKKYQRYTDFAEQRVEDIFGQQLLQSAEVKYAHTLSTLWLEKRDTTYLAHELPVEAQFAPVMAMLAGDFDEDGRRELLLVGNFYGTTPAISRFDASIGVHLSWQPEGVEVIPPARSGFVVPGESRKINVISTNNGRLILVGRNNDHIRIFRPLK